jgi:uncharacterized phage-like protein YoqJ
MVVAFLGHSKLNFDNKLKNELTKMIVKIVVSNDIVDFYLGGYGDFDSNCLNLLRDLKQKYANINLVFITPYLNSKYYKLENAKYLYDETIYPPIESTPLKFAISKRNEWMVDNCDFLFCYVNKKYGGAYRAYRRAVNKKVPLYNFAEY